MQLVIHLCLEGDSNPHATRFTPEPKSGASTNSAIEALGVLRHAEGRLGNSAGTSLSGGVQWFQGFYFVTFFEFMPVFVQP